MYTSFITISAVLALALVLTALVWVGVRAKKSAAKNAFFLVSAVIFVWIFLELLSAFGIGRGATLSVLSFVPYCGTVLVLALSAEGAGFLKLFFKKKYVYLFFLALLLSSGAVSPLRAVPFFSLLFFVYFFFAYGLLLYFIVSAYKRALGYSKHQIFHVGVGSAFWGVLFVILYIGAPFFGAPELRLFGAESAVLFVLFAGSALSFRRPKDIRMMIAHYFVTTFFILLSAVIFVLVVLVFGARNNLNESGMVAFASLLVVIAVTVFKKRLFVVVERIFYKRGVDYQIALQTLSRIIAQELDINQLLAKIKNEINKTLGFKNVLFFMFVEKDRTFVRIGHTSSRALKIKAESLLIKEVHKRKAVIIVDDLESQEEQDIQAEHEPFLKDMQTRKISVVIPIFLQSEISALLLLGKRAGEEAIGVHEKNLFEILSTQLGTAIEKARLYNEVKQFNQLLQQKIRDATGELRKTNTDLAERNNYLTILHTIGASMTARLNFTEVGQFIVNSIAHDLGYAGAALIIKDESGKNLTVSAFSETEHTEKILALLPKKPGEYVIPLETKNELSRVVRNRERVVENDLSLFLHPPLSVKLAQDIQRTAHVKTIIGVPIKAELGTAGCLLFLLKKDIAQMSRAEFDLIDSLSSEFGIVYHNLSLYRLLLKANTKLNTANAHLAELDETKSEFLSIAAHQLRTPLSGIKGYLSMMLEGDFDAITDEQRQVVMDLLSNTNRLTRLVNIFLDISRIEANRLKLEKEQFDLKDLLERIQNELAFNASDKNIDLHFHYSKTPVMVYADKDKLHDAIVNVVDNSIRYTDEGSVDVSIVEDEHTVQVQVTDTGIGIAESELHNLFVKFVRGREVRRLNTAGAGLGLYIAKKIMEAHGGDIIVQSGGVGKGTEFRLVLLKKEFVVPPSS